MARLSIRYLTQFPGPSGGLPRWFWQPSSKMRALGYRPERVPLNWADYTDAAALQAAAIARAQHLNGELDEARATAAIASVRPPMPPAQQTLGDLITHYKRHKDWLGLADKTRRGYLQCLGKIEVWGADAPIRAIDAARIQRLIASLSATPSYANAVARVLRLLLEHGRRHGFLTVNPAIRPGLTSSAPTGLIWPRAAVPLFVQAADAMGRHSIGTAVLLNEWLGQREGDILRLSRNALRAGKLLIRQGKTGAGVALPVDMIGHLMTRMADEEARQRARAGEGKPLPMTIIVSEETGLAYKEDNFRHVFAAVRARAAKLAPDGFDIDHLMPGRDTSDPEAFTIRMEDLTFMALRHTAVTRLGEAECDPQLIATITGHSQATVLAIMERYMVRTARMARVAFGRRLEAERGADAAELREQIPQKRG